MTESSDAEIRRVYERWHAAVLDRDIDGLTALYAADAVLESPLVAAESGSGASGILTGTAAIRRFFGASLRRPQSPLGRWYRTGTFLADGRQLIWEYPRATPDGDQVDLVEVMDLADGLIAHHRVYWGWVGFRSLVARLDAPPR